MFSRSLYNRSTRQLDPLYATDVALFILPVEEGLQIIKMVLDCFEETLGLHTYLQKICVIPIRYEDVAL